MDSSKVLAFLPEPLDKVRYLFKQKVWKGGMISILPNYACIIGLAPYIPKPGEIRGRCNDDCQDRGRTLEIHVAYFIFLHVRYLLTKCKVSACQPSHR